MHERLDDYILDIFQNAVEARSSQVEVELDDSGDDIRVRVKDNGPGMSSELVSKVMDPFYTNGFKHPSRKVGLGLPFLEQAARQAGGFFCLDSRPGWGTEVAWSFPKKHWDTPPLGDVPKLWVSLLNYPGSHEVVLRRRGSGGLEYEVRRSDLQEALGGMEDVGALALMEEYLRSQEEKE